MSVLLRMLVDESAQEIQLDSAAPLPRRGEIIETDISHEPGLRRMEVTQVRYVLANGKLNAVVECRAPSVGLANQGPETGR